MKKKAKSFDLDSGLVAWGLKEKGRVKKFFIRPAFFSLCDIIGAFLPLPGVRKKLKKED